MKEELDKMLADRMDSALSSIKHSIQGADADIRKLEQAAHRLVAVMDLKEDVDELYKKFVAKLVK